MTRVARCGRRLRRSGRALRRCGAESADGGWGVGCVGRTRTDAGAVRSRAGARGGGAGRSRTMAGMGGRPGKGCGEAGRHRCGQDGQGKLRGRAGCRAGGVVVRDGPGGMSNAPDRGANATDAGADGTDARANRTGEDARGRGKSLYFRNLGHDDGVTVRKRGRSGASSRRGLRLVRWRRLGNRLVVLRCAQNYRRGGFGSFPNSHRGRRREGMAGTKPEKLWPNVRRWGDESSWW